MARQSGPWRITPNALTLARIVAILPAVALFYVEASWGRWLLLTLFVAAALTDWFDGYLARKQGSTSPLGRFLDPIADKLLVAACLIMLVAVGQTPGFHALAVVVILLRELTVSGLREYLGEKGVVVPVTKLAKWKTTVQMLALSLMLIAPVFGTLWQNVGLASLWLAAALTLITGWGYLSGGIKYMRSAQ